MFKANRSTGTIASGFALSELILHSTVRQVRQTHGHAVVGLLLDMLQTIMMVLIFYFMMDILGLRGMAIRGDFLLYIMSGIFLYRTHVKTVKAVFGAEGPTSGMMKHAPMTTAVSISAAALSTLYIQILSMAAILYIYHAGFKPIEFENPVGAMAMVLLAWGTGAAVGLVFLALKPWAPRATILLQTIYTRANMFASGKMFVANSLPSFMISMFDWNPLFHLIDQARGFTFINYNPHFSSPMYPVWVGLACVMIGLMGEFYTRQYASISWAAGK